MFYGLIRAIFYFEIAMTWIDVLLARERPL